MDESVLARGATITPDAALIQRARHGDTSAFEALIAGRLDRCYRIALSILGNDADAADATQEACVSAWRELPRLREPAAFDGWLNRIVANAARSHRRHRVRLREIRLEPPDDDGPPTAPVARAEPRNDIDEVASSDAIGRAFDRLRVEDRLLLALHHVEGRPVAEIARSLGIPEGTVKGRLFTARRALERAMEAEA